METILLSLHVIAIVIMIVVILIQPPASEGIGMGSGSQSMFSSRGKTTILTRTTAVLATIFMLSSLFLSIASVEGQKDSVVESLMDEANAEPQIPVVPEGGDAMQKNIAPEDIDGKKEDTPTTVERSALPANETENTPLKKEKPIEDAGKTTVEKKKGDTPVPSIPLEE